MKKVVIIDYGMGNLGSISNMVKFLGHEPIISSEKDTIKNSEYLILPGVGKFDAAINNLKDRDIFNLLQDLSKDQNIHILGICLGMQLMCLNSEEGNLEGLGIFDAEVKSFRKNISKSLKVPHMGWNFIYKTQNSQLLNSIDNARFYFVHSFFVESNKDNEVLFKTEYGIDFVSGLKNNNNVGVQFHPEKSHKYGKEFFKDFLEN